MAHPKIRFGIRVGSATYGFGELPNLRPVLSWTSPITQLRRTESALIAVVNIGTENGYPRFFLKSGGWGKVSIGGRHYRLAAPPNAHTIEVNIGAAYDPRTIFVGAKVCLLCDDLSADNLSADGVAIDAYNIAMCATGAGTHFAEATSFSYKESLPSCVGPVVLVPEDDDKK